MQDTYWNPSRECMSREDLRTLQTARLKKLVERCYNNVPFYRHKMQELELRPSDIQTLDDLRRLPFTYKTDLRDNYPYGLFAVPLSEIVRIHASSGTSGHPTVVGYTHNDLQNWSEVMARTLTSAGCRKDSVVQISFGYGLFTGGLGAHAGAEKIGASVIPTSGGNTARQLMLMKDFGTTLLACTPSYALYLGEAMQEAGMRPSDLKLRFGLFGAEPWTENMRVEIERRLGITATDVYGISEIMGPGVSYECREKDGLHINEDHFIPEIINPETGEPLPNGEVGELVFSTITKEGIPLIRYRTRDLTMLDDRPCPCGRTNLRMKKVLGRSDDMLIIRGVNVFPSQVETVLAGRSEVNPYYQLVVERVRDLDRLEIKVEMSETLFSDEVRRIEEVRRQLTSQIDSALGINVTLTLVEPKSLERSEGKSKHVIDNRNLQ